MRLRDLTTPLYEVSREELLLEYGRAIPGNPKERERRRREELSQKVQRKAHGMSVEIDYDTRVAAGRKLEAKIFKKLQEIGLQVRDSSKHEDMYDKIDFWITIKGQEYPAQIKHREGGDDIIFEVYKDAFDETAPPNGRDYIGKAYFYVVENTKGQGFVVGVDVLKKIINEYLQKVGVEPGEYKGAQFKITQDRARGRPKMMAFFPPAQYGRRIY